MSYTDDVFNTTGKIAVGSTFWSESSDFVGQDGITSGFSRVLGEQVFMPLKAVENKFYQKFAGRPIVAGAEWVEYAIAKNANNFVFNPKATADDDLKFYESSAISKKFGINFAGRKSVSLPSDLATVEEMLNYGSVGQLNSLLVDNVLRGYQDDMESMIQKKLVSNTKNKTEVSTTDATAMFKTIVDIATDMKGNTVSYNEMTTDENGKIKTSSVGNVLCFINAKNYNFMFNDKAKLPSPDMMIDEGIEFIKVYDPITKPLTTAEFTAGGWDSTTKPVAIDEPAPFAFICSSAKCEVRPLIGGYRVNISKNGAGDFNNEHLIYKGAIAVRPWENAIRVNATV